jgi:hypothetical protein
LAKRTRKPFHDDATRQKIQTTQLINRLQDNAMGKINPELSSAQVKSIEILLRKALPDLSSVEHSGEITMTHEEALNALR